MNTANTAIVQRAFECCNKHDLAGMTELFSNCIYHSPVTGELKGDAYKELLTSQFGAFPDGRLTMEDQVTEGDKVVVRWSFTGTHKGELMGIAPTGKRIAMTGMSIMRLVGGKIVEAWEEWDNLGMMQQLGVVPPVKLQATVLV
jgi:predicted ester cyclase